MDAQPLPPKAHHRLQSRRPNSFDTPGSRSCRRNRKGLLRPPCIRRRSIGCDRCRRNGRSSRSSRSTRKTRNSSRTRCSTTRASKGKCGSNARLRRGRRQNAPRRRSRSPLYTDPHYCSRTTAPYYCLAHSLWGLSSSTPRALLSHPLHAYTPTASTLAPPLALAGCGREQQGRGDLAGDVG
jgi:hypothetical protein